MNIQKENKKIKEYRDQMKKEAALRLEVKKNLMYIYIYLQKLKLEGTNDNFSDVTLASAKDFQLTNKHNSYDELIKFLLSFQYFSDSTSLEDVVVPERFETLSEYRGVFEPLFLSECVSQIKNVLE